MEPHFDFYRVKKARTALIESKPAADDEACTSLTLVADYLGEFGTYSITIRFECVRELILPEMRPNLHFAELEIEDIQFRRLEGVRFEVVSHYDRSFRCLCGSIAVVEFRLDG